MARNVFLSFVEEDLKLVNLFRGQARNQNSQLAFSDYSVRDPYNSTNAAYIRRQIAERIRMTSVTVCLIGSQTAASGWVDWELAYSRDLGHRLVGVRIDQRVRHSVPGVLTSSGAAVLGWDISAIVKAIG